MSYEERHLETDASASRGLMLRTDASASKERMLNATKKLHLVSSLLMIPVVLPTQLPSEETNYQSRLLQVSKYSKTVSVLEKLHEALLGKLYTGVVFGYIDKDQLTVR